MVEVVLSKSILQNPSAIPIPREGRKKKELVDLPRSEMEELKVAKPAAQQGKKKKGFVEEDYDKKNKLQYADWDWGGRCCYTQRHALS